MLTQSRIDFGRSIHNGTRTSRQAAEQIRKQAPTLRAQVLEYVQSCGLAGATTEEIEIALGLTGNTVRPRIVELRVRNFLCLAGRTRPTRSGRQAEVYIAHGRTDK